MTIDVLPQEFLVNSSCIPSSSSQQICIYPMENRCPCFQFQKAPEPSPEVLEELQYQKEIQTIHNSTQKLVFELQHSKIQLALLKINKEIEKLSRYPVPIHTQEEPETKTEEPKPEEPETKEPEI
jgi:hypothetical protein